MSYSQEKYVTKTATINFVGSVDSFEPIKAVNNSTTVVLNEEGDLAALVLIKGFKFPVALMQEHFNENYLESDDYPKATLRGSLKDFKTDELGSNSEREYVFKGTLEMHGVKSEIEFPVQIINKATSYDLTSSFSINPAQFKIDIPSVVRKKIAQEIQVEVFAVLPKK